jgi:hypothetical protein
VRFADGRRAGHIFRRTRAEKLFYTQVAGKETFPKLHSSKGGHIRCSWIVPR